MEQRATRWNGGRPDGMEGDQLKRRRTKWNGGGLDATERNQMEQRTFFTSVTVY